jgi:serine/threonine protein phosphatase PrpC
MSNRLATRIGLPVLEERASDAIDVVLFEEPSVGALARTKGSLFLLAQISGTDSGLARASAEALQALQRDYYYDLSTGVLGALAKALANANRRLYHGRARLGIPKRATVSVIALVIRGREGHVAKLGPASAVIVREGRMFELPPPPAVDEEDPRVRQRRIAATLGEALEIEPYTWKGELAPDDRIALVSRNLAQTVGIDEMKRALSSLRPAQAVEHLQHLFAIRGGKGSDGLMAIEIVELGATATTHHLEPVRPAEPLAGLPDQSPVPLADAIGRFGRRGGRAVEGMRAASGRAVLYLLNWILAFVPRRGPEYPRSVPRTAHVEAGRRRRTGLAGMIVLAAMVAVGATVARLESASPTEAIPRAAIARQAIAEASGLIATVEEAVGGADLVDRDPERAKGLLNDAFAALGRAAAAGVAAEGLAVLQRRVDRRLDALYRVTRIGEASTVADLAAAFDDLAPKRMVSASDGSLWVLDAGRGRVIRVDGADGTTAVVYRAGTDYAGDGVAGAPWLLATAATDVVVIDHDRQAWRIDLAERVPRRMQLAGADRISPQTTLIGALQHRPPLEIFNLYVVDGGHGAILRWTPPAVIPVEYPDPPKPYLTEAADLQPARARDIFLDANLWLLQSDTVTKVSVGLPLPQEDYSLDPPPDGEVRAALDYRLLDGATVGDREYLYVYDAANARILAFQRADGAFVRQWMAPRTGATAGLLDGVRGMAVSSVPEGPAVAYLLTADGVVRIVLE